MRIVLVIFVVITGGACQAGAFGPDAGGDVEPLVQGSEARGELVVNEVAPKPDGQEDWVELFNRSETPIDLCGYFLTDSLDRLDHYLPLGGVAPPKPCPPVMLGAGDYLQVSADESGQPGHAPFKFGVADEVQVVTATGLSVDSLLYLYPDDSAGASLARIPNGSGRFYLTAPTPGEANPEVAP